jgi:bacterioferritin-associated ferredoxin
VIVCLCRGKNERAVDAAIDGGAGSVRDLMRCGIGDQCGSCHNVLRGMLARAAAAEMASQPCPACMQPQPVMGLAGALASA